MEVGRVEFKVLGESCGLEYRDGGVGPELPDRSMFRRKPLSTDGGCRSDMTIRGTTYTAWNCQLNCHNKKRLLRNSHDVTQVAECYQSQYVPLCSLCAQF